MATTTITFNGGSTTSATSNTSTNPSPQPSDHRDPLVGPDDDGANFHHRHHNNNNSVTSARALAHEKHDPEEPDPEHEEDEEEEGEIRRREVVSESSVDSCSQEELLHHHRDDRAHGHGSSASSASRNKKRKQSRPIRIPCTTDSSASLSPHAHSATSGLTPLNLSAKPNHHNGASAAASSMHVYMPFNLPMYQHASAGASASISPSSPSSSSNSNSDPESRSGRRRLSAGAVDLGERDGSSRVFGTATGQSQGSGSNHHHHNHHRIFNPEAYCDLCNKEFCNKYFLKTHKANKHGVYSDVLPTQCQLPTATAAISQAGSSSVSQAQHQAQQQLMDASSSSMARDSFCHLCNKDFCNKYFLRRHRAKIHGIQSSSSSGGRPGSGWAPDENESMEEGETTMRPEGRKRGHHQSQVRDTESKGSSSSSTTSNCGLCVPSSGQPHHRHRHHDEHHQHKSRAPGEHGHGSASASRKQVEAMQSNNVLGANQPTAASNPAAGAVFECSLCSHTFPSIYLLHMHMSYFHSASQLPSVSVPFSHSTDSIVSSAAPMAYLGLKLGPSPSPPTVMHGLKQHQHQDSAQAQDDDLRRLQSMILELSQGGAGRAAAASASASSVICPICCKEFYSSYFLSQHIATAHAAFSSIGLPMPSLAKESLSSSQHQQHQHQLHMQLKREANEDEDGEELRKHVIDEADDDEGKNLCMEDRQSEAGRAGGGGQDGQGQNEMMMMMMMMNAGAAAAVSAAGSLGLEDDESNNNTRESRNGHKKSRSSASRSTTSNASSLLLQDPMQSASGAAVAARVTPPMLPKSTKPVSPSLSRSYCTICHKELCNKYFMRTHMLKMHGINIESSTGLGGVTCDICHKELCSKYFLKVHKQNTHGIIEEIGVAPILTPTPVGAAGGASTPENANGLEEENAGRPSQNESPSGSGAGGSQQQPPKRLRGPGGKWTSARTKGVNGGGTASNNEDQTEVDEDEYEQQRSRPQSTDNQAEPRQIKQEMAVGESCLTGSPRDGNGEDGTHAQFHDSSTPTPMLDPLSMLLQKMDGGSGKLLYCRYCSFSTSLLVYLYAHERTHAAGPAAASSNQAVMEQVQLQCPMCFMTFAQVDQFQQHLVSHQLGPAASPQPVSAAAMSQSPNIRDTTHERRLSRHRINNNNELEYKIHAETAADAEPRPASRRVRVVRFKCSLCGQRFGSHAECQSHVLQAHKSQSQPVGRAPRRREPYNDNNPTRRFQCRRCEFVASGKKGLLVHSATAHRGRGWRSANTQRFLRAPSQPRTLGARRQHGAHSTKQADEAADLIVQRFLLHPDADAEAEHSDRDAEAAAAGGGGKKSGYFVPSVIYLPVREIVSESLRVSLTPHASSKY